MYTTRERFNTAVRIAQSYTDSMTDADVKLVVRAYLANLRGVETMPFHHVSSQAGLLRMLMSIQRSIVKSEPQPRTRVTPK